MDCGPATLKAVLDGFDIPVSYGRLREACQTEIDGTSIDTIEEVACQLGLDAEQIMVPADHILIDDIDLLPAIIVVRLPNGATHFVVAWGRIGPVLQLMDPATGRRWQSKAGFLRDVYIHGIEVLANDWLEWAQSDEAIAALSAQMKRLGISASRVNSLVETAKRKNDWHAIAALDAATRLVGSLLDSKGIRRGREAEVFVQHCFDGARETASDETIPSLYWSVRPAGIDDDGAEMLTLRGAVLVRIKGRREITGSSGEDRDHQELPEVLKAALQERQASPLGRLLGFLREDGVLAPLAVASGIMISAGTVMMEGLLFRGLLDLGQFLGFVEQRVFAIGAVALMLGFLMLLAIPTMRANLRIGRHLELRLRMAFLAKIPRLGDRYFHSRLSSDMAERAHVAHSLKELPSFVGGMWRAFALVVATIGGIIWLDPASAGIAIFAGLSAIVLPLVTQRLVIERDLRIRTHTGALTRFFLDSLLGLTALRCHAAEKTVRREHEMLLVEWVRSSLNLLKISTAVSGITIVAGYGAAAWLLVDHLDRAGESGMVLLLAYWVLSLPGLGEEFANNVRQIPTMRNIALRLFEPLDAPEESQVENTESENHIGSGAHPVKIELLGVSVRAGGHLILDSVDLNIESGSHVAIVGPSGAGKSSLVGLLLGWHRASSGKILVDGEALGGDVLQRLRASTAWIDPAVHLWNRSMFDNIVFGASAPSVSSAGSSIADILEKADLFSVLDRLPDGLQTQLGESGGLVSGGEGQRLRFARALNRRGVRLVILDEPFRGLARRQRRDLLTTARSQWEHATLLWVTHDIRETIDFERVLVVENGQIVEDGKPGDLFHDSTSRYNQLLTADRNSHVELWNDPSWRHLEVVDGSLHDSGEGAVE